jgi:hypothetical protein
MVSLYRVPAGEMYKIIRVEIVPRYNTIFFLLAPLEITKANLNYFCCLVECSALAYGNFPLVKKCSTLHVTF